MSKTTSLLVTICLILFSCSKDEETPFEVDFTATVSGESPNAQVNITNNSTGASTFSWTFGIGSDIESSSEKNPVPLSVDKSGDFSITLVISNGSEEKEVSKIVSITGENAIIEFTDLEFAQKNDDSNYDRFFSTSEGLMFEQSEINSTNGPLIDVVFQGGQGSFIFFESPDELFDKTYEIPDALSTKVKNYNSGFDVSIFDEMDNDKELKDLTIVHDNEAIGSLDFPLVVLFENSEGKKGAIKLREINSDRLLVDIKIQKY